MYKIPDLQYFKLNSLNVGHQFDIELPHNTLKYKIEEIDGYFLFNCNDPERNNEIFEILGIKSPIGFVRKVVNHKMFPEIRSKEDLLKVIVALDKECIKKFGDKNRQIVSTADLTINTVQNEVKPLTLTELKQTKSEKINLFPTKRHYKLNFSIN